MTATFRYITLGIVLIAIGGTIYFLNDSQTGLASKAEIKTEAHSTSVDVVEKGAKYPRAREITNPSGFLNTEGGGPITIQSLIGKKVILVDFWTYSCINCQRTLPYLAAWYDKYKGAGLEIVSIHTPEFEFEKDIDNVRRAAEQFGVEYPIVLDNDYGTWAAYQNRYWPRKYLIDIDGFIVYDHIGEGGYEETEQLIQELLAERADRLGTGEQIASGVVSPKGTESVEDSMPRTPEIYFGSLRNASYLANGEGGVVGEQTFSHPGTFDTDKLYLGGTWDITPEYARSVKNARIVLPYQAQKVFMVARSVEGARVRILFDGKPLVDSAGVHVGEDSMVEIQNEQLYRIVEDDAYGVHILEIVVEEGVLDAFSFTFG